MGSGKSTLGPALAARLGLPFVDLDSRIEADADCRITDLFDSEGEAGFRARETRALASALAQPPSVIASGGGAVLAAANRQAMRSGGIVVYLQIDPTIQLARLQHDASRPLLQVGDLAATLSRLQSQREALYRQTAHLLFDSSTLAPERVAETLAALIASFETMHP